jgi:uncharacterized protein (DUF433 family)
MMDVVALDNPVPLATDDHGVIRVGGTRVTLDTVVAAFLRGATAEEIVQQYPSLILADVYVVIGYYLRHRETVDRYLAQRQQVAEQVRQETLDRSAVRGVRERLLARRSLSWP